MNDIYKKIFLQDSNFTSEELENIEGHKRCYIMLLHASKSKAADQAQQVLNSIMEADFHQSCSIISEANALAYFYLRDFDTAKSFALKALDEQPESAFAYWVLATISFLQHKYDDAVLNYKRILGYLTSESTILDIARVYILQRDFKSAQVYIKMASPSTRKKLYAFVLLFSKSLIVRLLWILAIFLLLAVNPYLFIFTYVLAEIFLIYITIKWGYQRGDRMLFNTTLFIQLINSVFFCYYNLCSFRQVICEPLNDKRVCYQHKFWIKDTYRSCC